MNKTVSLISVLIFGFALFFTSCEKVESYSINDQVTDEVSLKSMEPEVMIIGTGDMKDYEKVVVEDVVKSRRCKGEPVSGIVEFYFEDELVFTIDFGDGNCDGIATVTWLEEDGETFTEEIDVWKLFKHHHMERPTCFHLMFPVTFIMPDGSEITINNNIERRELKEWYHQNQNCEDKPNLQFPVDIQYFADSTIVTINNEDEMIAAKEGCEGI